LVNGRDANGRFVAASAVASLEPPKSQDPPWMDYALVVNGRTVQTGPVPRDMPLLWVLRDKLNLKGTKYGCGIGACGACTIHLDGQTVRACQAPVGSVVAQRITTIEGLSTDGSHPLQKAWIEMDVPQCGYCQSGQLMSAAALLRRSSNPSDEEISSAM